MLLQVNESTLVDPKTARIALMINATDPARRELWIVCAARPHLGIEVHPEYQSQLLFAMGVDPAELEKAIG